MTDFEAITGRYRIDNAYFGLINTGQASQITNSPSSINTYSGPSSFLASEAAVAKLRKKELYKRADKEVLNSYRTWFRNMIKRVPPLEQAEFREKLDKILFLLGKEVMS